ncbi:Site-specific DNA methylase [Devosia sp. DBB001]|nr:Site-specific DNA methylase [Devosia sp. DBB001]
MTFNSEFRPVDPVSTPAPYIGGKRALSKRLAAMIGATPHTTYAEAFVGMGGVFLKRTAAPKAEVINDYNGEVANLFRILQRHYPQFMDTLKFQVSGRREFDRLQRADPTTLTDLERAARFLYLQRLAFGGKVAGRTFGTDPGRGARFNILKLVPMLEDVHERLAGVVIENLPWQSFLDRYDRPDTLFYLDPPYWGNEADYGEGMFSSEDFQAMADRLSHLQGLFVLSINDVPAIREIFAGFDLEPVDLTYTVGGGSKARPAKELIIRN